MGADLYLLTVFIPHYEHHQPSFEEWVQRRDALQQTGDEAAVREAQRQVEHSWEQMHACGYFRDSYNRTNLLWLFHLSWWADVATDLTDDAGYMSPDNARCLLQMLYERESVFACNLQSYELLADETRTEVTDYFQEKYQRLKSLLQTAIEQDEAIECSL